MNSKYREIPVVVQGPIEQINDTLSKARCRIFYKYENRNGTYITDEFAESLLETLPYTPIKGIFLKDEGDYDGHGYGVDKNEHIYGIVPEEPNIIWEEHEDKDGVVREYACSDIYLFSALYKEVEDIIGKAQSMELYSPSIEYHYEIFGGQKYIVFDKASFLGLQILGDKVEPCFEGAAFYSLVESAIKKIKEYSQGDDIEMKLKFKLSDAEKHDALWSLLNENFNEKNDWEVDYSINDIYDEYALAYRYEDGQSVRVYYIKDDEKDNIKIDKIEVVYVLDLTAEEKETIKTLRRINNDTFEVLNEDLEKASEYKNKNVELEGKITTLSQESSEHKNRVEELENQIEVFETETTKLKDFKKNIELQQKEAVISEYSEQLDEKLLDLYREKFEEYTVKGLDKELAYELKQANASIFSKNKTEGFIPKNVPADGVEGILSKYENNGG